MINRIIVLKNKIEVKLVTINILSYNRKDELWHTLTKVFEQDYYCCYLYSVSIFCSLVNKILREVYYVK